MVASNLLGAAGLAAISVAVGALTGNWWWSVLAGGLAAVLLAVIAQRNAMAADESPALAQSTPAVKPVPPWSRSA